MWGGCGNGSGHSLLALSQNSPVLPPAFTSWDNLCVCALPQPREARRTWLALAPTPYTSKNNQSHIKLLRERERGSLVSQTAASLARDQVQEFKMPRSAPLRQLHFLSTQSSLVFSPEHLLLREEA